MKKLKFIESPISLKKTGELVLPQLSRKSLSHIMGGNEGHFDCTELESCTGTYTPCSSNPGVFRDSCLKLKTCNNYCENLG